MSDPVLHVVAGPNGAGKSTFYEQVLGPVTGLAFLGPDERDRAMKRRRSFVTETVFSHPSKLDLRRAALPEDRNLHGRDARRYTRLAPVDTNRTSFVVVSFSDLNEAIHQTVAMSKRSCNGPRVAISAAARPASHPSRLVAVAA